MSRIHEALKRAEREKGRPPAQVAEPADEAVQVADVAAAPAPAAPPAAATAAPPRAAASTARVTPARQAPAKIVPPLTPIPALLESCRRLHWNGDHSKLFFLNSKAPTFATEQLRALRSRLYLMRERRALKKVLVTSALPAEGKTFLCANLAHAFARQHERRVLLVDCDLRAPGLHALLGARAEPGLTAYLKGEAAVEQVLQRGPQENLFLIPAGKTKANASGLLSGGKLKSLLDQLTPLFDWILLDTPAAGPVPDALAVADHCDAVLLVVREGMTPYDVAQRVTRDLGEKRLLGVVLNRAGNS